MGRSRGGLTTKIHAVVDAEGLPITLKLTEGHDGRSAEDLLDTLGEGDILLADRAALSKAAWQSKFTASLLRKIYTHAAGNRSILYAVYAICLVVARNSTLFGRERRLMSDIIFLAVGTGFFAVSLVYVAICDRL